MRPIDLETLLVWRDALHTQYQLHGDYSISPRASHQRPTTQQLTHIREAHLHIEDIINQLIAKEQQP